MYGPEGPRGAQAHCSANWSERCTDKRIRNKSSTFGLRSFPLFSGGGGTYGRLRQEDCGFEPSPGYTLKLKKIKKQATTATKEKFPLSVRLDQETGLGLGKMWLGSDTIDRHEAADWT